MSRTLVAVSLLLLSIIPLAFTSPTTLPPRTTLHTCTIFVQRWWDNSLDLSGYNYAWTDDASGPANFMGAESVSLTPGGSISGTMGSHPLVVVDVANPAVVNGNTNWNDPGKLSFTWGSQSFNSYSAGNPCTVIPVGDYGAHFGYPTNTTCQFPCDA